MDGDAKSAARAHISKFTTNSFALDPEAILKRT
jgi:hypothetical protein